MIKSLLPFVVLLLLSSCSSAKKESSGNNVKPNIIFILVDDLSKEWVSAYGAEDIQTPQIDALANSGIMFNNVYSMPQCTPSRVTLLTGQYPYHHGWINHWDVPRWGGQAHYDEQLNPSLAKQMKKAGYETCVAGKWQIDDYRVERDAMEKSGFDSYCMWTGYEAGNPPSSERYYDPYIIMKTKESQTYKGVFGPDMFADFVIDFITEKRDKPFFVYYPMVLTHTPFTNTPDEIANDPLGKHKAMVRYTDKLTGKIVNALEENGLRENTVIIWTTDNGTTGKISGHLNGRLVKGGKTKTTENGICQPFLVSWPSQIKPNQVSEALVDFSDVLPTCLDLAGKEPENSSEIDGKSFKNVLLKGDEVSQKDWILGMGGGNYSQRTENGIENMYVFRDRVIRNKKYKLFIGLDRKPKKFIDLSVDLDEKNNLLDSLTTDERKRNYEALASVIQSFPEKDNDPAYKPNPTQDWDIGITAKSQEWKQSQEVEKPLNTSKIYKQYQSKYIDQTSH